MKINGELKGWTHWVERSPPVTVTWILVKKPGEFPRPYLTNNLPPELKAERNNLWWKLVRSGPMTFDDNQIDDAQVD